MSRIVFLSDLATVFKDELICDEVELVKYFSAPEYCFDEKLEKLKIFLNEKVNIPFLITSDEGSSVEELDLCFELPPKLEMDIELYVIRDVNVKLARHINHEIIDKDYLRTEPGLYPDLLERIVPTNIEIAHINNELRKDIYKFKLDCKEKRYILSCKFIRNDFNLSEQMLASSERIENDEKISIKGIDITFSIISDYNEKISSNSLGLDLYNINLPESKYMHTEWFHCDCIADYYGLEVNSDEYFSALRNFAKAAREVHMNTIYVPIFTPALDIEYGGHRSNVQLLKIDANDAHPTIETEFKFDFSLVEKYVLMMDELGFKYFEICHLFSQWGAAYAIDIYANVNGSLCRIFDNGTKATNPEYIRFIKIFLAELKEFADRLKIKDRLIMHISDEPTERDIESYGELITLLNSDLEGLRRIDALSDPIFYQRKYINEPVIALDALSNFMNGMKDDGKFWIYYCVSQAKDVCNRFMSMPISRQRSLALQMYLEERIIGFLHWGFNFYNSQFSKEKLNPYDSVDAGGKFIAGDAFLFYPGKNFEAEWSLRALNLRRVFDDLRKLEYLESKLGREVVTKAILEVFDYSKKEFSYAASASEFKRVKDVINKLIDAAIA